MTNLIDEADLLEYTITIMEAEKRKLIKFSNYSLCITLPKWIVTKMNWNKGDEVDVEVFEDEGKLVISKNAPKNRKHEHNDNSTLRW